MKMRPGKHSTVSARCCRESQLIGRAQLHVRTDNPPPPSLSAAPSRVVRRGARDAMQRYALIKKMRDTALSSTCTAGELWKWAWLRGGRGWRTARVPLQVCLEIPPPLLEN